MTARMTVHPFPARMAPELVEFELEGAVPGQVLLDPMMGSGTFVVSAARAGHTAIGCDSDPLAHVIAAASVGGHDREAVIEEAERIVASARRRQTAAATDDPETSEFIDFWFDPKTRGRLSGLARSIRTAPQPMAAPLWCAFSRLIITKDAGASKARDTAHSRPHRVREEATLDPLAAFLPSVETVLERAPGGATEGSLTLLRGDARRLPLEDASVEGIMTSPPYLIAIDYLRGHRLSLVWMGYTIPELRRLRAENIGTERGADLPELLAGVRETAVSGDVPQRTLRILNRYIADLDRGIAEIARVLQPGGNVTFVVANARHARNSVSVEAVVESLAAKHGLRQLRRSERDLPPNRRYLPPPSDAGEALDGRMHTEVIATFARDAVAGHPSPEAGSKARNRPTGSATPASDESSGVLVPRP